MEMIKYQEMVIQRHFAISYSLYSCLIFPSRGSIHLKKKIKKRYPDQEAPTFGCSSCPLNLIK